MSKITKAIAMLLFLSSAGAALGQAKSTTDPAKSEIQLSDEQRAALRTKLDRTQSASDVSTPVTIGTALPAAVKLSAIPPSLSEIVPAYTGYQFVWVRDELVIVDPVNRVVMAVIVASKGG